MTIGVGVTSCEALSTTTASLGIVVGDLLALLNWITVTKQQDKIARAERLQTAIAALEARIAQLESEGEVAPFGCCVARYQARGQQKAYWYYKLQATEPIFPTAQDEQKRSRYFHLGPAGSAAHVGLLIATELFCRLRTFPEPVSTPIKKTPRASSSLARIIGF